MQIIRRRYEDKRLGPCTASTTNAAQLDAADYPLLTGPALATAKTVASTTQYNWGLHRILEG